MLFLGKEFAELNSMCWLETSAKDCTNVKEAFDTLAYKLCESHEQYLSLPTETSGPGSFTLHAAYGMSGQEQSSGLGYCCSSTWFFRDYKICIFLFVHEISNVVQGTRMSQDVVQ